MMSVTVREARLYRRQNNACHSATRRDEFSRFSCPNHHAVCSMSLTSPRIPHNNPNPMSHLLILPPLHAPKMLTCYSACCTVQAAGMKQTCSYPSHMGYGAAGKVGVKLWGKGQYRSQRSQGGSRLSHCQAAAAERLTGCAVPGARARTAATEGREREKRRGRGREGWCVKCLRVRGEKRAAAHAVAYKRPRA